MIEKFDLLNLTEQQTGYLICLGLNTDQLLLSGIKKIEIDEDFGEDLRTSFFHLLTIKDEKDRFMNVSSPKIPKEKDIKKSYKLRRKQGINTTVLEEARNI